MYKSMGNYTYLMANSLQYPSKNMQKMVNDR